MGHGERLRKLFQANGLNNSQIADKLKITGTAIAKHLQSEKLSHKIVTRYADAYGFDIDAFFAGEPVQLRRDRNLSGLAGTEQDQSALLQLVELQAKQIALHERYNELQDKHLELTTRFFPNAGKLKRVATNVA